MSSPARVSVILPGFLSHRTIGASLTALAGQSFRDFETIVVDSSPDDRTGAVVETFPDVTLIRAVGRMLPHEARNTGAARSVGRILVFTDPDCVARKDWLERIVAAHDEGWSIVGGAVEPMPGWWNRALHWTRYGWWMSGGPPSTRPEIPSANSSFSRELWERLGGYESDRFASDSEICWRARQAGVEIRYVPAAIVVHDHPLSFAGLVRDRWSRGRDFGRLRLESQRLGRTELAVRILASPLAGLVMTVRAARYAVESRRALEWACFTPVQWLGHTLWCIGEASVFARAVWAGSPSPNGKRRG